MNNSQKLFESLYDKFETYGKTTIQLAKLKTLEVTIFVVTSVVSKVAVGLTFVMFLLIVNLGLAIWIGELLGKYYYGFFVVAAFYLVAAIVFNSFLHKWIKRPISEIIIVNALQNKNGYGNN